MRSYEKLEREFADYIGTEYAVTVNTGTAALHLALVALGVGPGDEVIVPEFTMAACAYAVLYTGATPVYVDCGKDLNIDVWKVEDAITERTKAIMPVHIYGRTCDMISLQNISRKHEIPLVEDCSEAHGATYRGMKVGSLGKVGCFSLYQNKIVHAEEGGIIVTHDEELAERMRNLKNMAFGTRHDFMHTGLGFNYRMPDAMADMALNSLAGIEGSLRRRAAIAELYDEYLGDHVIPRPEGSVVWVYDFLAGHLAQERIVRDIPGARHFFKPMSAQPFSGRKDVSHLLAARYAQEGVYLPVDARADHEYVRLAAGALRKIREELAG